MDLETLFYIAIAAIYILSRLSGGKKKKKKRSAPPSAEQRQPVPPRPTTSPAPVQSPASDPSSELDEALREIRRALGWEQPHAPGAPTPAQSGSPVPAPAPIPPTRIETTKVEPVSARTLESRTTQWDSGRTRPRPRAEPATPAPVRKVPRQVPVPSSSPIADSPILSRTSQPRESQDQKLSDLRDRLRSPASAREAFIMSEIFRRRQ